MKCQARHSKAKAVGATWDGQEEDEGHSSDGGRRDNRVWMPIADGKGHREKNDDSSCP